MFLYFLQFPGYYLRWAVSVDHFLLIDGLHCITGPALLDSKKHEFFQSENFEVHPPTQSDSCFE